MFSQTVEYAIRAVVTLAHLNNTSPITHRELSEQARVPASYLPKLLKSLQVAGLVESRKIGGAGFSLKRGPEQITLLDVVNAVEPIQRLVGCPLGLESHALVLCPVHARVDQAIAEMQRVLSVSTIAELLMDGSRPTPMKETVEFLGVLSPKKAQDPG